MPQSPHFPGWKRSVAVALPLLFMGAIFLVSSIPDLPDAVDTNPFALVPPQINNLLHIPSFALLTFLWFGGLEALGVGPKSRYIFPPLIAFSFGLFDEWHQLSVPGRYGSVTDLLLDLVGIALGLLICRWFDRRFWS